MPLPLNGAHPTWQAVGVNRKGWHSGLGHSCPEARGPQMPHLGLEEALGALDALGGDIDLREAGQHVQPAVLLQLPGSCLSEDQEELQGEDRECQEGATGVKVPAAPGWPLACLDWELKSWCHPSVPLASLSGPQLGHLHNGGPLLCPHLAPANSHLHFSSPSGPQIFHWFLLQGRR